MLKTALLSVALGCLLPASWAQAAERNALMGFGVVGPAQFDQGDVKLMVTANVTGLVHVGHSLSLGGIGLAVRTTYNGFNRFFAHDNFDELGLAIPLVTYHRGRSVVQVGAEIQRANLRKNLYYMGIGFGSGRRVTTATRAPHPSEK
jgi:hypothetical protein